MPARLVSLSGTADIVLSGLLTVVGRHESCDACLPSTRISRRHCCLAFDGHAVQVRDLGSLNGTWIDGHRVEEGLLRPGQILGIGHLRYRLAPASPGTPAPARRPEEGPAADEGLDTAMDGVPFA